MVLKFNAVCSRSVIFSSFFCMYPDNYCFGHYNKNKILTTLSVLVYSDDLIFHPDLKQQNTTLYPNIARVYYKYFIDIRET